MGELQPWDIDLCDKRHQPLCPHPPADLSSPLRILPEDPLVTTEGWRARALVQHRLVRAAQGPDAPTGAAGEWAKPFLRLTHCLGSPVK